MNRTELACYCLIASAFVLGGLVLIQADRIVPSNEAQAEMVVNKDNLTVLTTEVAPGREIVYILDNRSEQLLAYELDPNKKVVELRDKLDVADNMEKAEKAAGGGGARGRGR